MTRLKRDMTIEERRFAFPRRDAGSKVSAAAGIEPAGRANARPMTPSGQSTNRPPVLRAICERYGFGYWMSALPSTTYFVS